MLYISSVELDVGLCKTETLGVIAAIAVCDIDLRRRHIDAHDSAVLTNELREQIAVTTAAATQIQHPAGIERFGQHEAAAVILGNDFVMDKAQRVLDILRRSLERATSVRFQIL